MKQKTAEKLITALGTAFLMLVFALWLSNTVTSTAGLIAAGISVLLIWVMCIRFVPVWLYDWNSPHIAVPRIQVNRAGTVFAAIILWDITVIILVWILRNIFGYGETLLNHLSSGDARTVSTI